jgi:uncharacterized glyoxalase superfamily protein PhnB
MSQYIGLVAIVVDDYDKAIEFYTQKLQFILKEDTAVSDSKRWVVLAPKNSNGCGILLAKAINKEQHNRIGNQTGGRVFLFLYTDAFQHDYQNLLDQQVSIVRKPVEESYGTVAVFEDLYGNRWDLISVV